MTETTPRREATRARLIEAAIHEFAERGIDATSVEQLCERADFSRGAFYSNFQTKDDLCIAILESYAEQTLRELDAIFQPPPDADIDWAVNVAIPAFFRALGPTADFRRTMLEIHLRATRSDELGQRLREHEAQIHPVIGAFLTKAVAHVGRRFSMPTDQVVRALSAVFFEPSMDNDVDSEFLGGLLVALTEPAA